MKIFELKADFEFEAENIDDALKKLSKHFSSISEGKNSQLILKGDIKIKLKKETHGQTSW
jgi:hypothetical protein